MKQDKLEYRHKNILKTALKTNKQVESRWIDDGKNASINFKKDWFPILNACQKWNKEGDIKNKRGTPITLLRRLTTGHNDSSGGHYSINNMSVFMSSEPISENKSKGLFSKSNQPVIVNYGQINFVNHYKKFFKGVKKPSFKSNLSEVTEEKIYAIYPELERFKLPNGVKVGMSGACEFYNYPGARTTKYKKQGLSLHEAGAKALKEIGQEMRTIDGKKVTIEKAAKKLKNQYPKHTLLEIINLLRDVDGEESWAEAKKSLNRSNVKRTPAWVWIRENGQVKSTKYNSREICAAKLGICKDYVNELISKGKSTKYDQYITKTNKMPTALQENQAYVNKRQTSEENPYMRKMVMKLIVPRLENELGLNEQKAVLYKLELISLEELLEFCNLTDNQIKLYADKAIENLSENDEIQRTPTDRGNKTTKKAGRKNIKYNENDLFKNQENISTTYKNSRPVVDDPAK